MKEPVVLSWSSGKDAALAYKYLLHDNHYQVQSLLTTINADADRIFMHGVREDVLDAQAALMGLSLQKLKLPPSPTDTLYKEAMAGALQACSRQGIRTCAFGDIFLEDLRAYREQQLALTGFRGLFPLWKKDTRALIAEVTDVGIEALIVCVDGHKLGPDFLGRRVDASLIADLPPSVDPCGENGEFHTLVWDAPFFTSPLRIDIGEVGHRNYAPDGAGFYFLDVMLK